MSTLKVSPYVFPGIKNQDEVKKIKKFKRDRISIDDILSIVARNCCVDVNHIISKIRKRDVIDARFIFVSTLRNQFYYPYQTIGKIMSKDHTTIIHAVNTHNERYHQYNEYKQVTDGVYEDVKNILE